MWTKVIDDMIERNGEVVKQTHFRTQHIIERHFFVQNAKIAGFFDISRCSENQPHRVVVEALSYFVVSFFGQWLILMVATAVGKLRRGNIDDAFACTFGYLVHKTYQILVRVAETHATTNAAFEKRCRTRKTECYHALILIPYIHHAVELFFVRGDIENA